MLIKIVNVKAVKILILILVSVQFFFRIKEYNW